MTLITTIQPKNLPYFYKFIIICLIIVNVLTVKDLSIANIEQSIETIMT